MFYLLIAIVIDLLIGDPVKIHHPVVIIGKVISFLEKILRKLVKSKLGEIIAGGILVLIVLSMTYFVSIYLLRLAYLINHYFGLLLHLYLIASTIAIKGLAQAGMKIYHHLISDDINSARKNLSYIVGRDTDKMEKEDIVRATVETIAENTSDGIIAPIFYYLLGGLPLAMTYKAVNTMDSMLGYLNAQYRYFGKVAARLDDLANYIPARLTGIFFCLVAVTKKRGKKALQIMLRDANKHPSPNAGYPEGAIAGLLSIRLGGLNYYHGKASFREYMGDKGRELKKEDIKTVIKMMYLNIGLFILCSFLILFIIY